jgi:hypothetical protein
VPTKPSPTTPSPKKADKPHGTPSSPPPCAGAPSGSSSP